MTSQMVGTLWTVARVEATNGRCVTEELSVPLGCGKERVKGCWEGGQK